MPELTPQQKLLEKLYRGKTQARPPTLKQKSLNRSFNKPSVSNAQKAQGARTSTSAAIRSKIRSTKAAYKSDLSRFSREVSTASSKARVSSAQNISKFGGGVKARMGSTVVAVKTLAVKQGVKTPALGRLLAGGTRFLAWTKANPGLALIVGNLIVWKRNVELLRGIYNHQSPPLGLMYPTTRDLINIGTPASFTGGQSDGVSYLMKYWGLTAIGNSNFQPLYRDPSDVFYTWGTTFIGKITGFQLRYPDGRPVSYASYKAAGKDFTQGYYLEIYSQNGTKTDVISFRNSWGLEPSNFVRADGQPDTGGNPPPLSEPVYSSGGVSTGDFTPLPNESKPKPPTLPETESEILAKPLAIPATSPKIEPVPATVPKVEPLPDDDVEKLPIIPLDRPTIRSDDPVKPTEQKKPANATVTTTRYATPQELEDIRKVIEEERRKTEIFIDSDNYKLTGLPTIEESQEKNRQSVTPQYSPTVITKRTVLTKPILPVVPTVERPTETRTSTGTGTNFPIIAPPVPGYKLQEPKAPAPTVTPVSGCSKGCAGGTGGGLSEADSTNLAKAADATSQLAILGIVKNTNEAVRHAKYGLEAVQKFGETAWRVTQADKVLAVVNTTLLVHNAMMLSNNLFQTMGEATSMALQALGIKDHEDNAIDVNRLVKDKIDAMLASVFRANNYAALTARTAKANRIYQSSINLLDTTRNMFDSAQSIAEVTVRHTGEIGNALRDAGVVAEDAYEEMIEKMSPQSAKVMGFQKFADGLEVVEEAFDSVSQISSNVLEIQENIGQLETEKTALIAEIDEDKQDRSNERAEAKVVSQGVPPALEDFTKDSVDGITES